MIHCSSLGLWYAVVNSWYSVDMTFGLVRQSARLCELLKKPILLIYCGLYTFRAAYTIRHYLLFACATVDILLGRLWESANICTGISCLHTNSICLRIASESSNKFAKAITSAESTKLATRRDLYDLYETGIELLFSSASRNIRPS